MQQLRNTDIDWEIHQLIERERKSFDEPPHLALRRLLKLPPPPTNGTESNSGHANGLPWIEDGVEVPHGSLARMEYQRGKQVYEGKFLNGKLVVQGQSFDALTAAANALAVTKAGTKPSLNGWLYWKVKFPGQTEWKSLAMLRDKVKKGK
jgi:hypothetical protein